VTSLVVTVLALQAAGSGGGPDCRPQSAAVREARALATGIVDADNARDLERVLGYYAADAVLLPPGEGPVQGLAAIRPRYGPGVATALRAGFAAWILSCVLMTITMANLRLFPFMPMAFLWSLFGDLIGTVAGAAVYKEEIA